MINSEELIYRQIYNIALENRSKAGMEFRLSADSFLRVLKVEPDRVNIGQMTDVPAEDLLKVAYVEVMKRLPEEDAEKVWASELESSDENHYKKSVVRALSVAPERNIKGISFYNNIYGDMPKSKTATVLVHYQKLLNFLYYKVYMKLPKGMRMSFRRFKRKLSS